MFAEYIGDGTDNAGEPAGEPVDGTAPVEGTPTEGAPVEGAPADGTPVEDTAPVNGIAPAENTPPIDSVASAEKITGTFGEIGFTNGVANITLKNGQSLTAYGLPVGVSYTVTETEANQEGYVTSSVGASGIISANAPSHAAFLNVKNSNIPVKTGSLIVSKLVTGNAGELNRDFNFTVTLLDPNVNGTFGDMSFNYGVAKFTLKHGESKSALNLPAGTEYRVAEDDANQGGYTTTATDNTQGTIAEGTAANVAFTNSKNSTAPDPGTGNLTVSKTVTGVWGDKSHDFLFKVTLYNSDGSVASVNGTYGSMNFTSGSALFTLRHGQSISANGLPAGLGYTVEERDNSGYVVTASGNYGTIRAAATVSASFINYKGTQPVTGDSGNTGLWLALMGVSLVALAIIPAAVRRTKKRTHG